MIGRRRHIKSRTGCTECKRRKVKCDETKPICFNCERYGSYDARRGLVRGITNQKARGMPILSLFPGPAGTPPAEPPVADAHLDRTAELMHHWCTITADTIATTDDQRYAWRDYVPRQGYENPFVMHALLSVAALHRAYICPSHRDMYLDISARHQVLGSEGFRAFLPSVTAENILWKPLLCFTRIIALYILCMPLRSEGGRLTSPILNSMELVASLKIIVAFVEPYKHLGASFDHGGNFGIVKGASQETSNGLAPPDTMHTLLPEDTFNIIAELRTFLAAELGDKDPNLADYSAAVDSLETVARLTARAGLKADPVFILYWPSTVGESVVVDIRAYKPSALILLAHFFVFFSMLERQFWFAQGWAKAIVSDIDTKVRGNPRMAQMMRWPLKRIWEHAL